MILKITDSRRLTGPNLFWKKAGAILDVHIENIDKKKVIGIWTECCRRLLNSLNWNEEKITHRVYESGASLVISAPIDCLYAATEVTEQAWAMTIDTINGNLYSINQIISRLTQEIENEKNPKLITLQKAAAQHHVKFLSDDNEISFGYGATCQVYPINNLPKVNEIEWDSIKDIPVAMVTGTNGKSTTIRLASSVVKAAGLSCGVTSTDYIRVGETILDTGDYSGPGGARRLLRHPQTETALLEVARGGMLRRGLGINEATTVVIMNVAEDHLGEYGINSLSDMVEAKFTIRQAINKNQDFILNADDAGTINFAKTLDNTFVWFSWYADNPVIIAHLKNNGKACYIEDENIIYQQGQKKTLVIAVNDIPITFSGAARHNVHNALAVTALCKALGFSFQTIAQGLKDFSSTPENNPGRGNIFNFKGITAIVDFAHNQHGLELMAQTIKNMPANRRLIMMGQAGDRSDKLIRGLVKSALVAEPDHLIICELTSYLRGRKKGVVPKIIHDCALAQGMEEKQITFADDTFQGTQKALNWAKKGDLLLILGLANRDKIIKLLQDQ